MSKKSELGKIIDRAAKGQKTVLGLPGQTKVSPERAKEILGKADVAEARKVLGEIVGDQKLADSMPLEGPIPLPKLLEDKTIVGGVGEGAVLRDPKEQGTPAASVAAPDPAPPAPVKPAPGIPKYVLAKRYSPKTDRNTATWNKIVAALAEGPKTLNELTEVVKDHKDFVGYMVRNGHLAVQTATG